MISSPLPPEAAEGRSPLEGAPPVAGPSPIHGGPEKEGVVSLSPGRRAWRRFRRNPLGFWSLVLFAIMVVLSLFAEVLSNDRPLVVRYEGTTYFPIVKD
ncbi:MAG: ABC transporter permease, partial [Pseudomonadota bacterium]|nr:ABC transporter permease [Pseudomonadota bacterium]